jgi:hypothetical protein
MSDTNDTAPAKRGTFYLLLLSICGGALAVGLSIAGLLDVLAGRWFGPEGGSSSIVAGAVLSFSTLKVVGLWRRAKCLSTRGPA